MASLMRIDLLKTAVYRSTLFSMLAIAALAGGSLSGCDNYVSTSAENGESVTDEGANGGTDTDADTSADGGTTPGIGAPGGAGGLVADHAAATDFDAIPATYIEQAISDYWVFYGHTSHGSQVITGMQMIEASDGRYALDRLHIDEADGDLGTDGDLAWVATTRAALNRPGSNINLVMWSWCGGVSDNNPAGINAYLTAMSALERDYPGIVFVYMTGHLDGSGPAGNLFAGNSQIRDYCRDHGKVLFDFADIESYGPAGRYYPDGSDACEWCETWCISHVCPGCDDCAHTHCFNCYQKGRAFWWLLARLAGWK